MAEDLTPRQMATLQAYKKRHLALTLSTDPANRDAAERGLRLAYEALGRPHPEEIIWFDSPIAAAKFIGEELGEEASAQLWRACHGQHDLYWISHWTFVFNEMGVPNGGPSLEGPLLIAENAGWWWSFTRAAVICDRPKTVHLDRDNQPHCEDGPAMEFRDGAKAYAWHGTEVPAEWIEKGPSVETALTHPNIEQRRCAAEIIGWDKVIERLDPKVIDEDAPHIGTLLEVEIPTEDGETSTELFLKVLCGTGRTFAICVTAGEPKTAHEANAWTYDQDPDTFEVEVRT